MADPSHLAKPFDIEKLFNQIHQLEIHTPQGLSGVLTKESRYVFNYHQVADEAAISLVMPVRQESYTHGDLMSVFAMNRPEGYLRYIIEERLRRMGAPSDMFLLYLAGSNQIGRLQYAIPSETPPEHSGEQLEALLSQPSAALFKRLVDQYALGSGISGVQPKALVPIVKVPNAGLEIASNSIPQPAEHAAVPLKTVIVKAEGDDFPGLACNEFFCMSVAKEAGFTVPDFWLSDDGLLFIMSRFDRKPDGTALGFEDMAVLTGRTANQKYEGSYEMIASAVEIFAGENSVITLRRLFERVALSCYLRDGDAHLKNFGMLYENPTQPRTLAPIYDVVCTDIYPELDGKMALKLNKSKAYPTDIELCDYARRLGISNEDAKQVIQRIENAYQKIVGDFKNDVRFQHNDLLKSIQKAIES
ncbi:MAG: type II toxin-antitoxin system HipA family toxin [Methylotenera sp.]|uniref:type II toxin-antitoxin system HipA family toxin n=1 Tax=Methylotenera sp. TaxID=2051956 RepID=UPI0017A49908|nr:type II toxin-antitoxin system HipA family toxin [Methylotenera sp.]NOU24688.1 type II toxin-antitoxin system HipA family toxin [Methylotenera sp.]